MKMSWNILSSTDTQSRFLIKKILRAETPQQFQQFVAKWHSASHQDKVNMTAYALDQALLMNAPLLEKPSAEKSSEEKVKTFFYGISMGLFAPKRSNARERIRNNPDLSIEKILAAGSSSSEERPASPVSQGAPSDPDAITAA